MNIDNDTSPLTVEQVLGKFATTPDGLSSEDARQRLSQYGSNEVPALPWRLSQTLLRQIRNPILILLIVAAVVTAALGDIANALIIGLILSISSLLTSITEYRAAIATAALAKHLQPRAVVRRDGVSQNLLVNEIVPGDIVELHLGSIVPADLRLIETTDLECDESVLTGESFPITKSVEPNDWKSSGALQGTIVRSGSGVGVAVLTGKNTRFGDISVQLSQEDPETEFQRGVSRFANFLVRIALSLVLLVVLIGGASNRDPVATLLFGLALAVGLTPQLLPAVVTTGLALGSSRLRNSGVLVKRLSSIEDLGDMDILVTDKTGTLTRGEVVLSKIVPFNYSDLLPLSLMTTDVETFDGEPDLAGLNLLDAALWQAQTKATKPLGKMVREQFLPFDHQRRIASAIISRDDQRLLVVKGSPDDVFNKCKSVTPIQRELTSALYQSGLRVLAVASRKVVDGEQLTDASEVELDLAGLIAFSDEVRDDAAHSVRALAALGIVVKIATGDSAEVAQTVCRQVGLDVQDVMLGSEIEATTDIDLVQRVQSTTIFARVSPEQKSRVLRALKSPGQSVGFLGDGVNDSIALHDADVGISVQGAVDVARDAADIVLLEKNLDVLAKGIHQGRRVVGNTMKYLLMGTAGDFGNMLSAAVSTMFLPFLPMLPSQILLQDLLYDASQLSIPSDHVDREMIAKPVHWDLRKIRRFMLAFGLASSLYDFLTFGYLLWILDANSQQFQTGWFLESLSTATLVVLAVRTQRVPFFKSRPSASLLMSVSIVVLGGLLLTLLPINQVLGFCPLPLEFYGFLVIVVICFLGTVEAIKRHL